MRRDCGLGRKLRHVFCGLLLFVLVIVNCHQPDNLQRAGTYGVDELIMSKDNWKSAQLAQIWGAGIALVAVLVESLNGRIWLLVGVVPPVAIFFYTLSWKACEEPPRTVPYLGTVTRLGLTATAAWINTACLLVVLFFSGGDKAIFAPILLLIPHTTAVFLRGTSFERHIWRITLTIRFVYSVI